LHPNFAFRRPGLLCLRARQRTFAVGAQEVRLFVGQGMDIFAGAEMEAGMLRIAIKMDRRQNGVQSRSKFNQRAAWDVVNGKFALFFGKCSVGIVACSAFA